MFRADGAAIQPDLVASTAAETAGKGLAVTAVVGVAAKIAAAYGAPPLLIVFGASMIAAAATASGVAASEAARRLAAVENGLPENSLMVPAAAVLDGLGLSGLVEGYTGRDLVTEHVLTSEERSTRLGTGLGSAAIEFVQFAALGRGSSRLMRAGSTRQKLQFTRSSGASTVGAARCRRSGREAKRPECPISRPIPIAFDKI